MEPQRERQPEPNAGPSSRLAFSSFRTRITTCYPNRVDAGPDFVPGLPHVVAHSRRPAAQVASRWILTAVAAGPRRPAGPRLRSQRRCRRPRAWRRSWRWAATSQPPGARATHPSISTGTAAPPMPPSTTAGLSPVREQTQTAHPCPAAFDSPVPIRRLSTPGRGAQPGLFARTPAPWPDALHHTRAAIGLSDGWPIKCRPAVLTADRARACDGTAGWNHSSVNFGLDLSNPRMIAAAKVIARAY